MDSTGRKTVIGGPRRIALSSRRRHSQELVWRLANQYYFKLGISQLGNFLVPLWTKIIGSGCTSISYANKWKLTFLIIFRLYNFSYIRIAKLLIHIQNNSVRLILWEMKNHQFFIFYFLPMTFFLQFKGKYTCHCSTCVLCWRRQCPRWSEAGLQSEFVDGFDRF